MDYINAATTGILPPHVLAVEYLQKMLTHNWRGITFNHALTSFLRGHTPLLQIPMHPHFDVRWTVSTTNWHTHTGSCTTTRDISNLQFNHTTQKLISTLWHRYQTFRHILWQNKSSRNFRTAVHYMSTGTQTVCSINAPLQPLANPPSCIAAIYAKDSAGIQKRCSLQIRNTNSATIPTWIAPNLWILTSVIKLELTGITLIWPDEAPRFILKLAGILWNRTSGWSFRQAFIYYCRLLQVWGVTRMHALIWSLKCLLSMFRCMLGSVKGEKSENPKGKGKLGNGIMGGIKNN